MKSCSVLRIGGVGLSWLLMIAAGSAWADTIRPGYTAVKQPASGEASHLTILQRIYGGTWTADPVHTISYPTTTDYKVVLGSITILASRIADSVSGAGAVGIDGNNSGTIADQLWHDGSVEAVAEAKFAGDNQIFGYMDGAGPSKTFVKLFDVKTTSNGYTFQNPSSSVHAFTSGSPPTWRWARARSLTDLAHIQSSQNSDNADGLDHMVTYQITSSAAGFGTRYLLFFEDRNIVSGESSDGDFNDLVVEVRAVPVPVPGTVVLCGSGLFTLGLIAVVGHRRNR
ncbi:MAG: hypothetical protein NTU53_10620 [Planctomycetota bacterium]|nr:hypothetical protein [Planctomycetota bacterium]